MEELKQGVQAESPSANEEAVNSAENTAVENSAAQETNIGNGAIPEIGQGNNPEYSAVDEFGVPYKNRYMETDRKLKELTDSLPKMIKEAISTTGSSVQQQPKYTVSQLEAYALEHPEYRPWVEEQKEVIRQEQLAKLVEERLVGEKKKTEVESRRQQAYAYVAQNNPELFTVQNGQKVWNNASPVVQMIGQLMTDPRFANDPDGIVAATDIAYGRYLRQQNAKTAQKVQMTESALKKEQRKNMVEGGSNTQVVDATPVQKAMENLRNKRTKTAAADAIKEIFKAQGVIR